MTQGTGGWELPISEHELSGLTKELQEAHRACYPDMVAAAADLVEEIREQQGRERESRDSAGARGPASSRRRFLIGGGGFAAAVAVGACSSPQSHTNAMGRNGAGSAATTTPSMSDSMSPSATGSSQYTGDLKTVALATALENQAVFAYQTAINAALAGKLGNVPAAVATFASTAMGQHADHAKAWNAVLTGAGKPAITNIPLSTQPQVVQALGAVTDIGSVAKFALQAEQQAAETYLAAASTVTSPAGVATAATIAPVEAMHAAILNFVLGQYPVPDDFLGTDKAAPASLLTV